MDVAEARFYPWHADLQERIARLHEADKLPHALLLSGPRYLGKRAFATAVAGYMLCRSPVDGDRCRQCDNCLLFAAGTHPDYRRVFPEERKAGRSTGVMNERKLIVVEQIRDLTEWAGQTTQRSGMRTVVIHPAEQMNVSAASALLKCLEEPGSGTLMMLVSDLPGRLLPTIRSRCQHIDFTIPSAEDSLNWLKGERQEQDAAQLDLLLSIGGGAPLSVVHEFDDDYLERRREVSRAVEQLVRGANPLEVAKAFARGDAVLDLTLIYGLFADALRLSLTGDEKVIKNKDMQATLQAIRDTLSQARLFHCVDRIAQERQAAAGPSNPNVALLFEGLLVEIGALCGS